MKFDSCFIMAIVNVTPDSFSDGGCFNTRLKTFDRIQSCLADSAEIIDIGAESTRPGFETVSVYEEKQRLGSAFAFVEAFSKEHLNFGHESFPLWSIDTRKSEVALDAIASGFTIVNDVTAGQYDPDIVGIIVDNPHCVFVVNHWCPRRPAEKIIDQICRDLESRVAAIVAQGVKENQIVIDPGFGFDKNPNDNWELLRNFSQLHTLGLPVMAGISRKRFITEIVNTVDNQTRDLGTMGVLSVLLKEKLWSIRVHNVSWSRQIRALAKQIYEKN